MANTDRLSVVSNYIYDLLTTNKTALGLQDVFFGDQQKVPRTPAVAVEPGVYTRELSGLGGKGRTDNNFTVYVLVYVSNIRDEQLNNKDVITLSEAIMDKLHLDVTMSGNVIHGRVTSIEPGYASRGGALMRFGRITWEGLTKTLIA